MAKIGAAVIGLGFMGRTHVGAYQAASLAGLPCELVAVCDPDPAKRAGVAGGGGNLGSATGAEGRLFDPARVRGYAGVDGLLADASVQLVSVCTYTDSHVELAAKAARAGKHVLVEKPVALTSAAVEGLIAQVRGSGRLVMPAMCMRFWPGWDWLTGMVRQGEGCEWGRLRSVTFQRLGSGPAWSSDFYGDAARSGGALFDLHIHDADFVCGLFGPPRRVSSAGSMNHVTTQYFYDGGPGVVAAPGHVVAEGAWDLAPTAGFRMRYLANFERATAEWDLSRTPALMVHTAAGSSPVPLDGTTGYDGEVRHLVEVIARGGGEGDLRATLADAALVARVLEAERESLERGGPVGVR
jgi:predicted dehydrogenase